MNRESLDVRKMGSRRFTRKKAQNPQMKNEFADKKNEKGSGVRIAGKKIVNSESLDK